MQISRRNALVGAGAAVVAGVPGATLANADPQIEALIGQLSAANADYDNINARRHVALRLIPRAVEEARNAYWCPAAAPQDVRDAYQWHYKAHPASSHWTINLGLCLTRYPTSRRRLCRRPPRPCAAHSTRPALPGA